MTPLETKANDYAQTLHPIGIDEVSVIVRDFCAGYNEAEKRHAVELQKLRDKVLDIVCTDLSTNSLSYQQLEVLFTKKNLTKNERKQHFGEAKQIV